MVPEQDSTPATGESSDDHAIAALMRLGTGAPAAPPEAEPAEQPEGEPETQEAPEEAADEAESDEPDSEAEEKDESAEEDDESKTHTVTYKGHKIQVTLQELKSGFLKERDYRQKTQQLALRQSEAKAAQQRADELAQQLSQRLQTFQGDDADPDDATDWAKASADDPAGTQARYFAYLARHQQRQQKAHERQQVAAQQQDQLYRRHLETAAPKMATLFPEWSRDDAKFQREYPALQRFAVQEAGIPQEQLKWVQPESWAVIRDAMAHRSQKKAAVSAVANKAPPKPVVVQKPGAVATKSERKSEEARAVVKRAVGRNATPDDAIAALTALGVR